MDYAKSQLICGTPTPGSYTGYNPAIKVLIS